VQKSARPLGKDVSETSCMGTWFAKVQKHNAYSERFYVRGVLLRVDEIDNMYAKVLR